MFDVNGFCKTNKGTLQHCHAYSLSLLVKDVTKITKILGDTMGTAEEIAILVTECFPISITCNVLETVITSFKDWFNQSSFDVYENIESLLLKHCTKNEVFHLGFLQ